MEKKKLNQSEFGILQGVLRKDFGVEEQYNERQKALKKEKHVFTRVTSQEVVKLSQIETRLKGGV